MAIAAREGGKEARVAGGGGGRPLARFRGRGAGARHNAGSAVRAGAAAWRRGWRRRLAELQWWAGGGDTGQRVRARAVTQKRTGRFVSVHVWFLCVHACVFFV